MTNDASAYYNAHYDQIKAIMLNNNNGDIGEFVRLNDLLYSSSTNIDLATLKSQLKLREIDFGD